MTTTVLLLLAASRTPSAPPAPCPINPNATVVVRQHRLALDPDSGLVPYPLPDDRELVELACDPRLGRVAIVLRDKRQRDEIRVLEAGPQDWQQLERIVTQGAVQQLALVDERVAATVRSRDGGGEFWTAQLGGRGPADRRPLCGPPTALAFSIRFDRWLVGCDREVRSYRLSDGATRDSFLFADPVTALAVVEGESWLVVASGPRLVLVDPRDRPTRGVLPPHAELAIGCDATGLEARAVVEAGAIEVSLICGASSAARIERLTPRAAAEAPRAEAAPQQRPEVVADRAVGPTPEVPAPAPAPATENDQMATGSAPVADPPNAPTDPAPSVQLANPPGGCDPPDDPATLFGRLEDPEQLVEVVVVLGPDSLLKQAARIVPLRRGATSCFALRGLAPGRYKVVPMGPEGRSVRVKPETASYTIGPAGSAPLLFQVLGRQ